MANTTKLESLSAVIARRRNRAMDRQGYVNLLLRILFLALVGWVLFAHVFLITQAVGNQMFPAVKDGDLMIGFRLQRDYAKNDVVVYTVNGQTHVGRVVAKGNDVLTMDESGTLIVNGAVQGGEILYPSYAKEGIEYPFRVPDGHVFVMGDYRTQAKDSRDFGPIPMDDVEGKVITILRRRGL